MEREPHRLSRAELRTWKRFLGGVGALFRALDRELRDDSGLSLDDFGLLRPLWESQDTPLTMTQLADEMDFSLSRTSHAVQRMEANGWVTREPNPDDKRVKLVKVTATGAEVFSSAWPHHAELVRELFLAQMSAQDRATIADVFTRVSKASRAELRTPKDDDV